MKEIRNEENVRGNLQTVFEFTCDIKNWPQIVKDCFDVRILEKRNDLIISETVSKVLGFKATQRTERKIFESEKMLFRHIKTPFPLKSNEGEWLFSQHGQIVNIILTHRISTVLPGFLDGLFSMLIGRFIIERESKKALSAIKKSIESSCSDRK